MLISSNNILHRCVLSLAGYVHTSVKEIPEGRIDELSEVSGLLCYVDQQWDCVILTTVEVQQGLRQTRLTCRWL